MAIFKTYDGSQLDDQIELVKDVIKEWDWVIWYPNKESLSKSYSQKGFTANTRHYAYENNKLVGFLSSTVEKEIDEVLWGSIHIPFIRKGFEHIEKELMDIANNILASQGVKVIRTIAMPGWGDTIQILERHGFGERILLSYVTLFSVSNLLTSGYIDTKSSIFNESDENYNDYLIETISKINSQSRDELRERLDNYYANKTLIARAITQIEQNIAYGLVFKGDNYLEIPGRAFLEVQHSANDGNKDLIKDVIIDTFMYLTNKAKEVGYETLWHEVRDVNLLKHYEQLELKFEPCYRYILRVE